MCTKALLYFASYHLQFFINIFAEIFKNYPLMMQNLPIIYEIE